MSEGIYAKPVRGNSQTANIRVVGDRFLDGAGLSTAKGRQPDLTPAGGLHSLIRTVD
jgi:non-ribosomal peptide synthetase component F